MKTLDELFSEFETEKAAAPPETLAEQTRRRGRVMNRQIGKAVGILCRAAMREIDAGCDWGGDWYACDRAAVRRWRIARRHALHVAGCKNLRQLRSAARGAMGNDAPIYKRFGFVPY
jgi:hypothetical protein